MSKTLRHITVDEVNYLSLKRLGSAGDSFNDVISKLLKTAIITTEKEIEKEEKVSCASSMVSSPEGRKKTFQPPMTQTRSET